MKTKFNYHITKFFKEYLPNIAGISKNTINSYRTGFVLLFTYLQEEKKLNIDRLEIETINKFLIEDFLQYLENTRKNSISTRNQRLAAIHSFFRYLKYRDLSYLELCSSIISIPKKKTSTKSMSYFSLNEVKVLINTPNLKTKSGFRDYILLLFMYETACRAQEIVNLSHKQIVMSESSYVILIGKGNKERMVPITNDLVNLLNKHFKINNISNPDDVIFKSNHLNKFTTKGIEYTLLKYIKAAKLSNPQLFNARYSNHSMRHTRAMHLLEAGINLIYIRDILGHYSVVTTEIYAKTNPKIKEQQILKYSKSLDVKDRYSEVKKQNLLDFLKDIK